MLLSKPLLGTALLQLATSVPLNFKPLVFLPTLITHFKDPSHATLFKRSHFPITQRGVPPPQCASDSAGEAQGCFTLQGASNEVVRFAVSPGQSFEIGGGLGDGASGTVAQCVLKDGTDIAVKQYGPSELFEDDCEKSFTLLKELEGNDHIIRVLARGKIQENSALAMELAADGDINKRMERGDYNGKDKEKAVKSVVNQLLDGLTYMHSKKIAHVDLWENNVVFKGDTAKLVDFDFACKDKDYVDSVPNGKVASAAPEGLYINGQPPGNIDPLANDVWTLVTMLIRMTTGKRSTNVMEPDMLAIWQSDEENKRVELIQKKWPEFSVEFTELLAGVFCRQEKRIKMDALKEEFKDVSIYC